MTRLVLDLPSIDGGFSGIELNADGTQAVLLSDRGWLTLGEISRDADGLATEFAFRGRQRLRHDGETKHPDSEGLVQFAPGEFYVSTEGPTRVVSYQWGKKFPHYLPPVPTDQALDNNRGFEALAQAPDGSLVTFFEVPDLRGAYSVFRYTDGAWDVAGNIPSEALFSIVGADFDDRGYLYLLERAFSPLGFRSQIRRIDFAKTPLEQDTLFRSDLGEFDNLEGIAVTRTRDGHTRMTLISDDNYAPFLKTELVEILVTE